MKINEQQQQPLLTSCNNNFTEDPIHTLRIPVNMVKRCKMYESLLVCRLLCEGEVAFFSAKRWDRRNRADLIESATPCHDAQVVGPYRDSNPLRLTILAAMSEDYTTAPQHLLIKSNVYITKPAVHWYTSNVQSHSKGHHV